MNENKPESGVSTPLSGLFILHIRQPAVILN